MKTKNVLQTFLGVIIAGSLLTLASCKEDEPPVFGKPVLEASAVTVTAKPGEDFTVNFTLEAEGGNNELVVNKGGGFLERIILDRTAITFAYEGTADADALEGDDIAYEFILINTQDLESDPVAVTVNIEAYDEITIGTTTLFEVTIPEGGIVPAGTTIKFAQGRDYFIGSSLSFAAGSEFIVEADVTVYMSSVAAEPVEINLIGATVNIEGTATNPVVMTSDKSLRGETPAAGDWDQFRLENIENSTIRYVRIEYAGDALRIVNAAANNTVEYIQAFKASTRGFYFTNGSMNARYLYALNCGSTNIRLGDAYAGRLQFVISNDTEFFVEIEEVDIRETAAPIISNLSVVGPGSTATNTHGVRLRASSSGKIFNSIVAEFPRRGVRLNDQVVTTDITGATVFAHSFVFNVPTDPFREDRAAPNNTNPFPGTFDATTGDRLTNPFFNNVTNRLGSVWTTTAITGIGVNDFIPNAEQVSTYNPTTLGAFFIAAPFVGAIKDNTAASDWTKGWTKNSDGTIR